MPGTGEPAWSEDAEATLEAVHGQLGDLPDYPTRMNVLVNALRLVMMKEAYHQVRLATEQDLVELPHMTIALQMLVDEFCEEFKTVPKMVKDVIHAETGCGQCEICKQAMRDINREGKVVMRPTKESQKAVESLIATMLGKR